MAIRFHYQTISSYRELPPKWKYVSEPDAPPALAERCVQQVDLALQDAQTRVAPSTGPSGGDLVAMVFANQAMVHDAGSRQLADLITERRALAQKHADDIRWRLDAVLERRPIRNPYGGGASPNDRQASDVERQALDLEKQLRDVQLTLWRDTLELRQTLLTERREYRDTRRRMTYLTWGTDSKPSGEVATTALRGDDDAL